MSPKAIIAAALLVLAAGSASAQDQGGSSDPSLKAASDPHGAIKAMSKAADPSEKADRTVTAIPNLVPSSGSSAAPKAAKSGE